MNFNVNDTVRFKTSSMMGVGLNRRGQIGKVIAVHQYPGQGGPMVDITFGDDDIERGIRVHELEHA